MKLAVALIAIAALGCEKKREEPVRELPIRETPVEVSVPKREAPVPVSPRPPAVFPIDKLPAQPADAPVDQAIAEIARVAREHAPELAMIHIDVHYARKDGTLDPTYGALEVTLSLSDAPDGIVDDPNRPTGAPVPETKPVESGRTECPIIKLQKGRWLVEETGCPKKSIRALQCGVVEIWKRALLDGAPENAVAMLQRDFDLGFWRFEIQDKIRKVDFKRYIDDTNCAPPAPASGSAGARPNPYK